MNPHSIVLQRASGQAAQLFLLFHGVGADPSNLAPLGKQVAAAFPQSTVVSVAAPQVASTPGGYQWFSVVGITEANRIQRVAEAMPEFLAEVRAWQRETGVAAAATALVGFSQGAIMALESCASEAPTAGRVVAIAGRFARLPDCAPARTTIHLLHGKEDPVIPYRHSIEAAQRLLALGGDVTADVLPFVGHAVERELADLAIERLKGHVPRHVWDEVMREDAAMRRSH